jgi:MFS family permease
MLSLGTAQGRRTLAPILLAAVQQPLNSSLLVTALVPIGQTFHVTVAATGWLVAGLYIASAVGQPMTGKFVDAFGPRRTMVAGLAIVAVAGIIGTSALAFGWLLVARVMLGLGSSAAYPAAMSILRRVNGEGRPVPTGALSLLTIAAQVSIAFGPVVGGAIVVLGGWRWTQAINAPVALVAIAMALLWLPKDAPAERPAGLGQLLRSLDLPGVGLFAAAMAALLVTAESAALTRWEAVSAAAVLIALFVWRERRTAEPFVDFGFIAAHRPLARTYIRQASTMLVSYGFFYGIAWWLQQSHHVSAAVAGAMMLPNSIVAVATAATAARALSPRTALLLGTASAAVAAAMLFVCTATTPLAFILAVTAVFGIMGGMNAVANQSALYIQSPAAHIGLASGLFRTSQYAGATASTTALGIAYGARATDPGMHLVALVLIGLSLAILAATFVDRTIPRQARTIV